MELIKEMQLLKENNFKTIFKNKTVALYTLRNKNGLVVQITNFGAKIASIYVPDKHGKFEDVVLGYDTIKEYLEGHEYYGAICGRYANRIAEGKLIIDGNQLKLPINNGPNHLHGGPEGLHNQVFDAESIQESANGQSIKMTYLSHDCEMGYPGNLTFQVVYTLTDSNELKIEYFATTDKTTHVNICSHSYFNLAGAGNGDILDHLLQINADTFTPIDNNQIPTGEIATVKNTPMDFTVVTPIGQRIEANYEQLTISKGYDHNWVLNKKNNELGLAAICSDPLSGRVMEVYTTQPGIQIYTGNFIDNDRGKGGKIYKRNYAVCLETQSFPDSPNKPQFPSTLLKPGERYQHTCIYKFTTK